MNENKKDMKKASIFYFIGTLFNKGIAFITVPIFTRILTVEDYGIVTTYNSWVTILSMILGLALYMAVRLAFVDYEEKVYDFLSTILLFTFSYGLILIGIVCVAAYLLPVSVNIGIIILCLLQALGSGVLEDISQFLMMQYKYKFRTIVMILPNLLSTVFAIVLIKYVISSHLYLGRIVPTALITFSFGIILSIFFIKKGKFSIKKEYIKYGLVISLPLVLHGISLNILSQSDRTMITILRNATETGIYGLIYNFSMIATVITTAFDGVWVPFFMQKMKDGDYKGINEVSIRYIELMTIAMIGVVLVGPEIVKVLATEAYWEGIRIIPPIVLSNYLIFLYTLYVYIEHYHKKTVFISINTMIAAVSNILLNYFFIKEWGYAGAAYTTLISYALSLVLHYCYARKLNKEVIPLRQIVLPSVSILIIIVLFNIFMGVWYIRWGIAVVCCVFLLIKERTFILSIVKRG